MEGRVRETWNMGRESMNIDQAWLDAQFPELTSLTHIGHGGQKLVFAGQHEVEGEVVLKLFYPSAEPQRVVREIQAVQNIKSIRVPEILGVGRTPISLGEVIWVREEIIEGEDLRRTISHGPMSSEKILRLSLQILEVLTIAEKARIVHRDVKPDNIMASSDNNYYLLDFGLARHLDEESLTATALAFGFGTPGYAPPEQFRNLKSEIDSRSDLFALGVTLYECIEGVNPFRVGARDIGEVVRRVESQPLPPITRQIDSGNQMRDLLVAMTRVRRDHRPATASDALEWMEEICAS